MAVNFLAILGYQILQRKSGGSTHAKIYWFYCILMFLSYFNDSSWINFNFIFNKLGWSTKSKSSIDWVHQQVLPHHKSLSLVHVMLRIPFFTCATINNPPTVFMVTHYQSNICPMKSSVILLSHFVHMCHIWSVHITPSFVQMLYERLQRFEERERTVLHIVLMDTSVNKIRGIVAFKICP